MAGSVLKQKTASDFRNRRAGSPVVNTGDRTPATAGTDGIQDLLSKEELQALPNWGSALRPARESSSI